MCPTMAADPLFPLFPPLRGGVSLIQGRYGQRGNFELVAPDERDGLWVFWFNNDLDAQDGTHQSPPPGPGEWSSGLRFAEGRRFDDVCMAQSTHGPNHLEVVARSGTQVHRYRWSPELGFTDEGTLPTPPAAGRVSLVETADGLLHAAVPLAGSGVARLVAEPSKYPQLDWSLASIACPGDHVTAATLVPDPATAEARLFALVDGAVCDVDGESASSGGVLAHAALATADGPCHVMAVTSDPSDAADSSDAAVHLRFRSETIALPGHGSVASLAATTATFDPDRIDAVVRRGTGIIHLRLA